MAEIPQQGPNNPPTGATQPAGASEDASQEPQNQQGTGPVGDGEYVVRDGDCMSSIAKESGHFWETIWNDPGNADLKTAREDPNVLLPGDKVTIPDLREKEESGATEQLHRFRRKGEPTKLKLRLMKEPDAEDEQEQQSAQDSQSSQTGMERDVETEDEPLPDETTEDEPRADVPYLIEISGERHEGRTDADGYLEVPIPGNSRQATLTLNPGTDAQEELRINLGALSPISEVVGVKQRLANLSFECGDRSDELTDGLNIAIRALQRKHGQTETGELTEEFRQMLVDVHGS